MSRKPHLMALRASLFYVIVAGLWILFSDRLLVELIHDQARLTRLETDKGWVFVAFTGVMFFFILRQLLAREEQKIRQLEQAETLANLQRETLERIALGKPLPETLNHLLRGLETLSPEMLCSVLLLDSDSLHLRHGAAPSLPDDYTRAIDGVAIGAKVGSCGTAAFRGSPVFVSDIAADPLWADYKHLALAHGLRACWSTPILDEQKKVLGTFAIYHRHTGLPTSEDVRIVELVTQTVTTGIIKQRDEKALRESKERFRTLVEQASDAIFVHDVNGKLLDVNQSACETLGYARKELLELSVLDIDEDVQLLAVQKIWHQLKPGQSQIVRGRHRRKNGTIFPVEVSVTCYEFQGQLLMAALARNLSGRKEYEEQLARSVSLLRATIESSASGILVVSTEGKATTYNDRFLEMWRIPAELAAQGDDRMMLNQVREQMQEPDEFVRRVEELYQHPEQESGELILFKDGRVYDRVSRPQRLGDKIIGRVWSFRDITAQKVAAEKIAREQARFKLIFDTVPVGIAFHTVHPDGSFTRNINDAHLRICGLTRAQHDEPEIYFRISHPDDRALQTRLHNQVKAGRTKQFSLEKRYLHPDGKTVWVNFSFQRETYPDGTVEELTTVVDITERKQGEEALRESEHRLQQIAASLQEAVWLRDADTRKILYVNPAFEQITGHTCEEFYQKHSLVLDLIHPEDREAMLQDWEASFITKPFDVQHRIIRADGSVRWVHGRMFPVRNAAGEIYRSATTLTDITEQVEAEQSHRNLETQLRQSQKMEAIGQLSGGIAHDFNNILTVIQGNAALLQELDLKPEEIRDCSIQIARAGERAASLTRQLLMFARKQQMQPVNLDLNETALHMTKMLQRILGEDIALRSEYSPTLPRVHADTGMIEQIILNLAVNARDAMPDGGTLTIRTLVESPASSAAPAEATPAHVCLAITDTGLGIAPEILPRIFEPFFTTKEVGKGTGLGLATVYGIVQQHRGEITVQSAPGTGTTFKVYFPIADSPASSTTEITCRSRLAGGRETILLVEDEAPLRAFVSELLQRCGYTILEAGSGPTALAVWQQHKDKIQLLLTDVIMPENLNGIELGRRLRAEKSALKVIHMSGYTGNLEGRHTALIEGVNFIRKPFKPEAITEIIRKNLDGRQAEK